MEIIITTVTTTKMNKDFVTNYDRKYLEKLSIFHDVCKQGNVELVNIAMYRGSQNWNYGLAGACQGGNMDIVKLMISKGANNWNIGLCYACQGGHMDIVELMISKGANHWNNGLEGACEGGRVDIVELMVSKGAKYWSHGFRGACRGGHMDIVQLMIDKGADDWKHGFRYACWGGHINIIELIISKGLNDYEQGYYAIYGGHMNVLEFIKDKLSVMCDVFVFPYKNIKTKYYHNDVYTGVYRYYDDPNRVITMYHYESDYEIDNKYVFMYHSILYWMIMYNDYSRCYKKNVHKHLISDLLKILYF